MPGWGWSRFADPYRDGSLAQRFRAKRHQRFLDWLPPGAKTVLDVGGTAAFWRGTPLQITVLSPNPPEPGVHQWIQGTVKSLDQFADRSFDVAFSNSVIEHVGSDRQQMAHHMARIGRSYWVQTPNRYFPIEPHFLFPGFQFLPVESRIWLIQHLPLGWSGRIPDRAPAAAAVREIQLLSRSDLRALFPKATVEPESWAGLPKSWIAHFAQEGESTG